MSNISIRAVMLRNLIFVAILLSACLPYTIGQNLHPIKLINTDDTMLVRLYYDLEDAPDLTMYSIDRAAFVKDDYSRITFNATLYHPGTTRPGPPGGVVRDLLFDLQQGELSLSPVPVSLFTETATDNQITTDWQFSLVNNDTGHLTSSNLDVHVTYTLLAGANAPDLIYYWTSSDRNKVYLLHLGYTLSSLTIIDVNTKLAYTSLIDLPVNNTAWYNREYGAKNVSRVQYVPLASGEYLIGVGTYYVSSLYTVSLVADGISKTYYNLYHVDETTLDPTKVLVLKSTCPVPGFLPALFDASTQQLIAVLGIESRRVKVTVWNIESGALTTNSFSEMQPYQLYEAYVNTVVGVVVPVGTVVIVAAIVVPVVLIKKKRNK